MAPPLPASKPPSTSPCLHSLTSGLPPLLQRLGRERIARITNAQLFAGRCLLVVGSSDPATCIAGLKLVAIFVPLVAENMDIHCKVGEGTHQAGAEAAEPC